jgi:hypothetical protein
VGELTLDFGVVLCADYFNKERVSLLHRVLQLLH